MSSSDINVSFDYSVHPKTTRLISLIGKRGDVFPIRMWIFLGKYHPKDGRFHGYSEAEIEGVLGWDGPIGELVSALVRTGFLDRVGDQFKAHDWIEHEAHIWAIKKRNKKVALNRWKNYDNTHSTVGTTGIPKRTSGLPLPSSPSIPSIPSIPNKNKPKEHMKKPLETFVKPSAQEVTDYSKSLGKIIDGESFFSFYESKGWLIGKSPMKNWKAAVVTWQRRENTNKGFSNAKTGNSFRSGEKTDGKDGELVVL